jgi:mRNA interferase MazF
MEQNIKRGDIYYVDFGVTIGSVQGKLRPVVVLQNDTGNLHSPTIIVATITSKANKKRQMPTHIVFNMEGLSKESIVQLEQITTIDKSQILNYVGEMPQKVMRRINKAIKISLDLD